MDQLWGLSGPEFLWLYGAGLIVAAGWAVAVRARARRPRLVEPPPMADLDTVAYLAGGARRVVELALARLIEDGQVRVHRGGTIRSVRGAHTDDPLGAVVLKVLARRSPEVDKAIRLVGIPGHLRDLAETLIERRLVVRPAVRHRVRWLTAPLGLYVLLVVGVLRFVGGSGGAVGVLAVGLGLTVVVLMLVTTTPISARTVHGDRALREARGGVTERVGPVAFDGLGAFPDPEVRAALTRLRRPRQSGGGGGGSGGCGSVIGASYGSGGCGGGSS